MAPKHRAESPGDTPRTPRVPAELKPDDTRGKRVKDRRPGPRHAAPEPPRKRAAKKAAPTSAVPTSPAPVTAIPAPRGPSRRERRDRQAMAVAQTAEEYARRAAIRGTTGRPSVTGRAASGAAAGAAAGATLGSVVPGVGTAVGTGAGAVLGGAGGAISGSRARRAYKAAMRTSPHARRLIVVEFTVCMVIVALSPLTDRKRDEPPGAWMKRMTAVMGLFFILALLSAGGRGLSRFAAGLGGLVAVTLAVSERDLFVKVAQIMRSSNDQLPAGPGEEEETEIGKAIRKAEKTPAGREAPKGGG